MSWLQQNWAEVWGLFLTHAGMSAPPILLGLLIAVPLGWLAHRFRWGRGVLLTVAGLLYTIPSLALIVAMPLLLGTKILNPVNLIVALTLYAVALLVRTAAEAFDQVSPAVLDAATGMGYGPWRRFWGVQLPLAGPVILAGVRVVSSSTVSLVTLGALVGMSGLGYLFTDGTQRGFPTEILIGIVGTVLIALVFDVLIVALGRLLMPWTRSRRRHTPSGHAPQAGVARAEAVTA
ncbi:ABC transporter permease [Leucobacter sp. M11]|uniref:ABC transporter permease n=1 Tax=Leucobacter sp. M11 TaxID=2993565 RepID=UPI002D7EFD35|nr:ABC transporter permease [Leucobacter sp. M11]MEB4616477.1 ABC transporter permease [Leucobacter sp. M11]